MRRSEQLSSREHSLQIQRKQRRQSVGKARDRQTTGSQFLLGHPVVRVPRELDLIEGSNSECHIFFEKLRDTLASNPKRIYLDFRFTTMLKAMPLLVLYSILDEAR